MVQVPERERNTRSMTSRVDNSGFANPRQRRRGLNKRYFDYNILIMQLSLLNYAADAKQNVLHNLIIACLNYKHWEVVFFSKRQRKQYHYPRRL